MLLTPVNTHGEHRQVPLGIKLERHVNESKTLDAFGFRKPVSQLNKYEHNDLTTYFHIFSSPDAIFKVRSSNLVPLAVEVPKMLINTRPGYITIITDLCHCHFFDAFSSFTNSEGTVYAITKNSFVFIYFKFKFKCLYRLLYREYIEDYIYAIKEHQQSSTSYIHSRHTLLIEKLVVVT